MNLLDIRNIEEKDEELMRKDIIEFLEEFSPQEFMMYPLLLDIAADVGYLRDFR
jgi:hypothetical protein